MLHSARVFIYKSRVRDEWDVTGSEEPKNKTIQFLTDWVFCF